MLPQNADLSKIFETSAAGEIYLKNPFEDLKRFRIAFNLTQEAFGHKYGFPVRTVIRMEQTPSDHAHCLDERLRAYLTDWMLWKLTIE